MSALQDFVINEGLHGWNVRYYLTAIQRKGQNDHILQVAYEVGLYNPWLNTLLMCSQNLLPHFPVLLKVYNDVQATLFSNSG